METKEDIGRGVIIMTEKQKDACGDVVDVLELHIVQHIKKKSDKVKDYVFYIWD